MSRRRLAESTESRPVVFAAATGAATFGTFYAGTLDSDSVARVASIVVAVLAATTTFFDPSKKGTDDDAASRAYDLLVTDIMIWSSTSRAKRQAEVDAWIKGLGERLKKIDGSAPGIPWAVRRWPFRRA